MVNGETITTHYIDKLYEVEIQGQHITTKAYISDVAIVSDGNEAGDKKIRFTLRDRLGSAITFTDELGNVTAYRHFDPFGKSMSGDWSQLDPARLVNNPLDMDMPTRRGFTDHEHLDEVELIHMNGRVYDYNVGRFMSVDPVIQSPGNSQSVNPYNYIMNNPLSGTDPTGYSGEKAEDEVTVTPEAGDEVKEDENGNLYLDQGDGDSVIKISSISSPKSNNGKDDSGALANSAVTDKNGLAERNQNTGNQGNSISSAIGNQLDSIADSVTNSVNSLATTINDSINETLEENKMLIGFIKDEGTNVLLKAGQAIGGAGQVVLGAGMCAGSGVGCAAGALIAAKGLDNMQSGLTGKTSVSQQFLRKAIGNDTTGDLINAGLDLGTSVYGLVKAVPKVHSLGAPIRSMIRKDPAITSEAAFKQASAAALGVEAFTSSLTVLDSVNKLK